MITKTRSISEGSGTDYEGMNLFGCQDEKKPTGLATAIALEETVLDLAKRFGAASPQRYRSWLVFGIVDISSRTSMSDGLTPLRRTDSILAFIHHSITRCLVNDHRCIVYILLYQPCQGLESVGFIQPAVSLKSPQALIFGTSVEALEKEQLASYHSDQVNIPCLANREVKSKDRGKGQPRAPGGFGKVSRPCMLNPSSPVSRNHACRRRHIYAAS